MTEIAQLLLMAQRQNVDEALSLLPTIQTNEEAISADVKCCCDICTKIILFLETGDDEYDEADFGRIDDLLSSQCPQLRKFLDWLSTDLNFQGNRGLRSAWTGHLYYTSGAAFHVNDGKPGLNFGATKSIAVDIEVGTSDAKARGVKLHPNWIDEAKLVQWHDHCVNDHQVCSDPPFLAQIPEPRPTFLINTTNMYLVPSSRQSFIGLSYVWGKTEMFKTASKNLRHLQRPGAFNEARALQQIPKAIRQAIQLVMILKERYLWIDTLCIIQDDIYTFKAQIDHMASIFAHTTAVIIAADGTDADYGLRGMKSLDSADLRYIE